MTRMFSLRAMFAASVWLLPLYALAQTAPGTGEKPAPPAAATPAPEGDNWIMLGGQYDSNRSFYLGRFSGAVDPGFYGLGSFHYGQRDAWDSGGTNYFELNGRDLGLTSRSFDAKVGQQGTWGLNFSYDGIPYNATNGFQSVWTGNGSLVPGVAAGSIPLVYPAKPFVSGVGTVNSLWLPSQVPSLAGSLAVFNLGTQRDVFTSGGKYEWNDWTITAGWRHEHKTGYQSNSLEIGGTVALTTVGTGGSKNVAPTTGVTSALGYFAQPLDYDTDRFDITAAYGNPVYQAQIGYTFSHFTDNIASFNAINPFGLNPTSTFGTAASNLSAPYALPPSNSAHQVKLMLGYNITPTTRLNANFAYGVEMQNEPFNTASGDPVTTLSEPRASFNGLVQTMYGNIAMTAQPLPKLDVRVSYTINDFHNQSPSNSYQVDTRSNTSTSGNGDCAIMGGLCTNLPFGYDHQTFTAEAGYRILPQTKVTLNETFETMYRSYADTSFVTTNTVTAKIRSQIFDDVFGALSYSHQDRDAHNYTNGNTFSLLSGTGVGPDITGFLMYFEASRKHDEVKGTIDVSPTHDLTTTLMAKFSNDVYPGGQYGLRNNHNIQVGPDISWQPTPALSGHAFYTFQQTFYDTNDLYQSGTFPPTGTGFYVPYTTKTTDSVHTLGLTMDWQAIQDLLKISFEYSFSYGDTAYALGDGMALIGTGQTSPATIAGLAFQALPDVTSMLSMIQIRGEYKIQPNMTLIFGYAFERFTYKDFMNGTSATAYANALLPGTLNPNDSVHVIGAGMRVRF
jgi:MtrB/PioB family decaheme-associated outer membrane protein